MAFKRPTLKEIIARIVSDIETGLNIKLLMHAVLRIVATAYAGAVHLLHGHISWGAKQIFITTSDDENVARHSAEWGLSQKPAAFAVGNVTFTGTDGNLIPAQTELQNAAGSRFLTAADVTLAAGTATVSVTAVNAGIAGNLAAGTSVSLIAPLAGVNTGATVATGGITGGVEIETIPELVARVLSRKQNPPHGGADFDYVAWAKEVPGVTRAFAYRLQYGIGTVGVAILADDTPGGPTAGGTLIAAAQAHINIERPTTADVTVWSPASAPLAMNIHLAPDSAAIRAAVTASLADLFRREAEPGKTILLSKLREAVSTASGENDNTIVTPTTNYTVLSTQIATLGVITWS